MKPTLTTLLLALILLLALGNALNRVRANRAEQALEALADEKAASDLKAAGYEATLAHVSRSFLRTDSLAKALAADASRRVARVVTRIESRVDTVIAAQQADSGHYEASIDMDPITGKVAFFPVTTSFGLNLICAPQIEQYIVQTASDKLLIGVRALSPRTLVRTEAFDATPYLRRTDAGGVRWYHLPIAALAGAIGWELAR